LTGELRVEVLPNVIGLDKSFSYKASQPLASTLEIGDRVKVPLRGKVVEGWVLDIQKDLQGDLLDVISKKGPGFKSLELLNWAAYRYVGKRRIFAEISSPKKSIKASFEPEFKKPEYLELGPNQHLVLDEILNSKSNEMSFILPPLAGYEWLIKALAYKGYKNMLLICPTSHEISQINDYLTRNNIDFAVLPEDWYKSYKGVTITLGTLSAAFAPIMNPSWLLIYEPDDPHLKAQKAPTYSAFKVLKKRRELQNSKLLSISFCPVLNDNRPSISFEKEIYSTLWPQIYVLDKSKEDPLDVKVPIELLEYLKNASMRHPALVIYNRLGNLNSLMCLKCNSMQRCETCGSLLVADGLKPGCRFTCQKCMESSELICRQCLGTRFKGLSKGIGKVKREIEELTGKNVGEVTAKSSTSEFEVAVGTHSLLYRNLRASSVIFYDFDHELWRPNFDAAKTAVELIARAMKLLQKNKGVLVLRTSTPEHLVIKALTQKDPYLAAVAIESEKNTFGIKRDSIYATVVSRSNPGDEDAAKESIKEILDTFKKESVNVIGPSKEGHYILISDNEIKFLDTIYKTRLNDKAIIKVEYP
jgi:primosomal protein N'